MNELQILYDHYKDTYNLSKNMQDKRNKNFVILCVLEMIAFITFINSEYAYKILLDLINNNLENPINLSKSLIQTFLWIMILYFSVKYCQSNIYIERQYKYIERLEKTITNNIKDYTFNRESENYLEEYPFVLNFIDVFYTWIVPLLFIIVNTIRMFIEIKSTNFNLLVFIDIIIYILILILSVSYMIFLKSYLLKRIIRKLKKINDVQK